MYTVIFAQWFAWVIHLKTKLIFVKKFINHEILIQRLYIIYSSVLEKRPEEHTLVVVGSYQNFVFHLFLRLEQFLQF